MSEQDFMVDEVHSSGAARQEDTMVTQQDGNEGHGVSIEARVATLETRFDMVLPTLASKADLERGFGELRTEMSEMRGELRGEISGLRTEMIEMRGELRGEMAELRSAMAEQGNTLRSEMVEQGNTLRSEMVEQGNALRSEMVEQGNTLRSAMAEQASALQRGTAEQGSTLRSETNALGTSLRGEISELRTDIYKLEASMKGWMVATTLTIAGFTSAAIFAVGQVNKTPPPASAPINITIPGLQPAPAPAPR